MSCSMSRIDQSMSLYGLVTLDQGSARREWKRATEMDNLEAVAWRWGGARLNFGDSALQADQGHKAFNSH